MRPIGPIGPIGHIGLISFWFLHFDLDLGFLRFNLYFWDLIFEIWDYFGFAARTELIKPSQANDNTKNIKIQDSVNC